MVQLSSRDPPFTPRPVSLPTPPDIVPQLIHHTSAGLFPSLVITPLNPYSAPIPHRTTAITFSLCGGENSEIILGHLIRMSLDIPSQHAPPLRLHQRCSHISRQPSQCLLVG
ncbi:hypothetical protein BLNAU_6638 [Blattamonas nauphoetae]|uniref:Uncharacterized protein n=1 Tax=Blattamonas nauphoetae TaxID=2049346 RepID=A0ABQ9Y3P5_9EUKA|nr:hypothetical protein BLNAU_6638 [Blattamonas nauphoetae]